MDAIDRKILAALQLDGRLTVTDLAQHIGLSAAPCHRRLRELERTGVIRGYRAVIDGAAVGHGFEVHLAITMDAEASVEAFEAGLSEIPEVVHADRLFGEPDYFVRVMTADIESFQHLRDSKLSRLPGVQRLVSTIVMKKVVDNRPLPT
ncbi:Lrp/AsnC family transcriptional regulator [Kribbella sp. NPDC026611]|uniref:Lrp/AsnC family transcriptional regulator n=1 Tax=Kribbella sp. NPDC026611 TaxID=3154911 RepID=UPI0033DE6F5B